MPEDPFISGTLDYIDCQAQTIGEAGYQALASPLSSFSPLLTLALTIFIAITGYRLLIGDTLRGREIILSAIKVGMVLLLATSWPAFRIIAYDLVLRSPANLSQTIGVPADIPGATGGLSERLQNVDNAMAELAVRGTGGPDNRLTQAAQTRWITYDPIRSLAVLEQSRTIYASSSIAAFSSVRLVAGILLALGPLFALFLLFDGTRGLFEGWVRGLIGAIIAGTATAIILGVELALLEPLLAQTLQYRRAGIGTPMASGQMLATTIVFSLILLAALLASIKIAQGFRFPASILEAPLRWAESFQMPQNIETTFNAPSPTPIEERSRAQTIAEAAANIQRRENTRSQGYQAGNMTRVSSLAAKLKEAPYEPLQILAKASRRRTVGRASVKSVRRDAR